MLSKAAGRTRRFLCATVVHDKGCADSPARPCAPGILFPSKEKISSLQKDPRAPSLVEEVQLIKEGLHEVGGVERPQIVYFFPDADEFDGKL